MTSGAWVTIKDAAVSKIAASSGCQTAGMRRASGDVDEPLSMLPEVRVLQPSMSMLTQSGSVEEYVLDIPVEVVAGRPAGRKRADTTTADIAAAIQVEFQSDVDMGVNDVVGTRIEDVQPGLIEYARDVDANGEPIHDGYRLTIRAHVYTVVSRTP